ncbi:MAG: NYN domain-containing protein [Bacteroidetes bacterium]|nr:NYN domain-containing protein [Bacteroidota bacterium]
MTENYNKVKINQSVAVLIDGNNIEISLQSLVGDKNVLLDFDAFIPKILNDRGLSRLIYFREGKSISPKLAERLLDKFHGSVMPCHKSADIPLTIKATQIANKVDTIIILSGDADYVELVRHLRGEGVRVEIAAVEQTTARILKEEADHFTAITEADGYVLKPKVKANPQASQKPKPKSKSKPKPSTGNRKRGGGRPNQNKGKTSS